MGLPQRWIRNIRTHRICGAGIFTFKMGWWLLRADGSKKNININSQHVWAKMGWWLLRGPVALGCSGFTCSAMKIGPRQFPGKLLKKHCQCRWWARAWRCSWSWAFSSTLLVANSDLFGSFVQNCMVSLRNTSHWKQILSLSKLLVLARFWLFARRYGFWFLRHQLY